MATIKGIQTEEEKDKQSSTAPQAVQTGPQSISTGNTGASGSSQFQSLEKRPKGSGRFTNINKYLQANQGGGQRIANTVGSNIQDTLGKQSGQAQDYYSKLGQSIAQAKQANTFGGQKLQGLKDIGQNIQGQTATGQNDAQVFSNRNQDLGINAFTSAPDFAKFQEFQAGRGVNENLLGVQQKELANAANQYVQGSQDALKSLSSEGGRFDLLKRTFGGNVNPQYNMGQQRLDELFLAREGLGDLTTSVQDQLKSARNLDRDAARSLGDVRNLTAQEQQLMADIGGQSATNQDAYLNMLGSYIPEMNRQREQDYQQLQDFLSTARRGAAPPPGMNVKLSTGPSRYTMTPEQMQRLGITGPTQTFDTFQNIKDASDIAVRNRDAANFQDVANQQDVDRFAMLNKIAGTSPEESRLKEASTLKDAWESKSGSDSLTARINRAKQKFNEYAREKQFREDYTVDGDCGKGNTGYNIGATLDSLIAGDRTIGSERRHHGQTTAAAQRIADAAYKDLMKQGFGNVIDAGGTYRGILNPGANITSNEAVNLGRQADNSYYHAYDSNLDEVLRSALNRYGLTGAGQVGTGHSGVYTPYKKK